MPFECPGSSCMRFLETYTVQSRNAHKSDTAIKYDVLIKTIPLNMSDTTALDTQTHTMTFRSTRE